MAVAVLTGAIVFSVAILGGAVLLLARGASPNPEDQVWGSPPDRKVGPDSGWAAARSKRTVPLGPAAGRAGRPAVDPPGLGGYPVGRQPVSLARLEPG